MITTSQFLKKLHQDEMTKSQQKQRFALVLFAEIVIVAFMLFVTISDFVTGNNDYKVFSIVLLVLYMTSLLLAFFLILSIISIYSFLNATILIYKQNKFKKLKIK